MRVQQSLQKFFSLYYFEYSPYYSEENTQQLKNLMRHIPTTSPRCAALLSPEIATERLPFCIVSIACWLGSKSNEPKSAGVGSLVTMKAWKLSVFHFNRSREIHLLLWT